jgi:hypothetical protein
MIEAALLLSSLLHRPPELVLDVYIAGGLDAVAVVEMESEFNPKALRREPRGHTSYGLFQLDNEWHPQHRDNLTLHIAEGAWFLQDCMAREGGDFVRAVSRYNSGSPTKSRAWGERVLRERNRLEWWLYIRLR